MSKGGFNWKGITDNSDGTYTAASRIEKRRLLKSLHASGYTVRSTRQEDGSWKVAAVGTLSQTRRRSPASGYKMRTRYNRPSGRYVRITGQKPGGYHGAQPRPIIVGTRGPQGPSMWQSYMEKRAARKLEKEKQHKQMMETNEKMKKERIEAETKQQRGETAKTIRKEEFAREKARFEHSQAQRERDANHKPGHGPSQIIPRPAPQLRMPPRAQKSSEPYIKHPYVEKSPKVDPLVLQSEREHEVTGG